MVLGGNNPSFDWARALASQRRAVVFADLVESVRLFSQAERTVIERWYGFAQQVRDMLAPARGGRVVRTAGDGLLLAFPEVQLAVGAAHALHRLVLDFNRNEPPERCFWLRVGIHLDDVVAMPNDLLGAGVNIAARLAALAQPGQTYASAGVRHELADGVHAVLHDLGLRFVKHLEEPLRVYRLDPVSGHSGVPDSPPAVQDLRPTVAVVPFRAVPADAAHDALGHALADDVIASLARHPALRVLSRASTALLRAQEVPDLQALRLRMGATFLLTGHYYVHGRQTRLAFELCELEQGTVIWTGRASGDVAALFEGVDDLVPGVVAEVSQRIVGHELARARSLPVDALSSYSLFVGASGLLNSLVKQDFDCARQVLEHLAERHPRHAAPLALLARWQVMALEQGWLTDRVRAGQEARALCERGLERDADSAATLTSLAQVCANFESRVDEGCALNREAISRDPTDALAWAQLSGTLVFLGELGAACAAADECLRLSPFDPSRYLYETYAAMAYLAAGDHPRAASLAASSVRQHSLHAPGLHLQVGAQWLSGDEAGARRTAARYLSLFPKANAGTKAQRRLGHGQAWRARFEQALIGAGIPP